MQILGTSSDDEMIATFLRGELSSERFGADIRACLDHLTPNSYPVYTGNVVADPQVPCTRWLMLNPNTGVMIESSWFRCPPTRYKSVGAMPSN